MSPIVRVLAVRALAATRERVIPRQGTFGTMPTAARRRELPPARPFVLPEPALFARGEDLPDACADGLALLMNAGSLLGDCPLCLCNLSDYEA